MVNRIKYSPVADIEVAVPVLCIDHFVHAHILHEEPDHSISMLYHRKAIWLPNLALCVIFLWKSYTTVWSDGEAHHSFTGPPCTHGWDRREAAQHNTTTAQSHSQEPQWDTGYESGYSGYCEGGSKYPSCGYSEPSLRVGTSAFARYPDKYSPLERYISYGADQAKHAVEGIGWLKWWMDDFATVQTEMQVSIDSQTSMMHDFFGHFRN
jgi:hypothetical protein